MGSRDVGQVQFVVRPSGGSRRQKAESLRILILPAGFCLLLSARGDDKINVPVLAVMTKGWAPDTEQFYRSLAPRLEYHAMDGVGHFLMMEKPGEFNETLAAFITKNGLLKK